VHGARSAGDAAAAAILAVGAAGERVVVVGAGAAGARAARRLADGGREVVVVEARRRTGGRVHTARPDGWPVPVELGASWVHDTSASDLGVRLGELGVAAAPFRYDGVTLTASGDRLRGEEHLDRAAVALERALVQAGDRDRDSSVAAALRRTAPGPAARRWLPHLLRTEVVTEYGADPGDLSAWWGLEEGTEGTDLLVTGGYGAVVDDDLRGLDVRLGTAVVSVDHGGRRVELGLARGASLRCDRVVLTVPLGVLRSGGIRFRPRLPAGHRRAVEAVGMGLLDKIWLRWERPWWTETAERWTVEVPPGGPVAEWYNLLPATGHPVIMGLLGGRTARAWGRRTDDEVRAAALRSLGTLRAAGW
jgi:monoamine oxidase